MRLLTALEATIVFVDHVARLTPIRTVAQDEWRAHVELSGQLDVANADQLREELDGHLDAGRRVLRVDASKVDFMDSTAVGALVAVNERCRKVHGSLILTGVRRPLARLLRVVRLDEVLLVDSADHG